MIIEAYIRTPQFKDNKVLGYVTQTGALSTVTWLFEPTRLIDDGKTGVGMHKVQFKDENDYLKAKWK